MQRVVLPYAWVPRQPSPPPLVCRCAVNWRQDTWSDLQLFMLLNASVFIAGAWVEVRELLLLFG